MLTEHVCSIARQVLGLPEGKEIDPWRGFFELGMDSLMSIELRATLERGLGQALPVTLAFDFPNVAAAEKLFARIRNFGERATHDLPAHRSLIAQINQTDAALLAV